MTTPTSWSELIITCSVCAVTCPVSVYWCACTLSSDWSWSKSSVVTWTARSSAISFLAWETITEEENCLRTARGAKPSDFRHKCLLHYIYNWRTSEAKIFIFFFSLTVKPQHYYFLSTFHTARGNDKDGSSLLLQTVSLWTKVKFMALLPVTLW